MTRNIAKNERNLSSRDRAMQLLVIIPGLPPSGPSARQFVERAFRTEQCFAGNSKEMQFKRLTKVNAKQARSPRAKENVRDLRNALPSGSPAHGRHVLRTAGVEPEVAKLFAWELKEPLKLRNARKIRFYSLAKTVTRILAWMMSSCQLTLPANRWKKMTKAKNIATRIMAKQQHQANLKVKTELSK